MKKFISLLSTSLVLLLATSTASAMLIQGGIGFTGSATVTNTPTEVAAVGFNTVNVSNQGTIVTGDFDGLEGDRATFTNIIVTNPTPYSFWEVGGFNFKITSITTNFVQNWGGLTIASIGGQGTITKEGFDDTVGEWVLTSNGFTKDMSFSSTTVPAPAGAALLGLGLIGFGFARRNKKAE